jgi:hypothetical protein
MNNIVMQAQKSLMNAFKFDEADLEANRMGQFSERQRARLVKEAKSDRQEILLHSPMLVIIIGLIAQFGLSLSRTVYTKFAVLLFTVFLSVVFVGKVILTLVSIKKIELQRVEGPIFISDPSENENGKDESRRLSIGNQGGKLNPIFIVYFDLYVMAGYNYVFYYIKSSKGNVILSAEIIE